MDPVQGTPAYRQALAGAAPRLRVEFFLGTDLNIIRSEMDHLSERAGPVRGGPIIRPSTST